MTCFLGVAPFQFFDVFDLVNRIDDAIIGSMDDAHLLEISNSFDYNDEVAP